MEGSLKNIWNFAFAEGKHGVLYALAECATAAD
jgi:hypothetical protein